MEIENSNERSKIKELLNDTLSFTDFDLSDEYFHLYPDISDDTVKKKIDNAINKFAPDVNPEEIVLFLDGAFLKSGKKGIIFTSDKIYVNGADPIGYEELTSISRSSSGVMRFNQKTKFKFITVKPKNLNYLVTALNFLIEQLAETKSTSDNSQKENYEAFVKKPKKSFFNIYTLSAIFIVIVTLFYLDTKADLEKKEIAKMEAYQKEKVREDAYYFSVLNFAMKQNGTPDLYKDYVQKRDSYDRLTLPKGKEERIAFANKYNDSLIAMEETIRVAVSNYNGTIKKVTAQNYKQVISTLPFSKRRELHNERMIALGVDTNEGREIGLKEIMLVLLVLFGLYSVVSFVKNPFKSIGSIKFNTPSGGQTRTGSKNSSSLDDSEQEASDWEVAGYIKCSAPGMYSDPVVEFFHKDGLFNLNNTLEKVTTREELINRMLKYHGESYNHVQIEEFHVNDKFKDLLQG